MKEATMHNEFYVLGIRTENILCTGELFVSHTLCRHHIHCTCLTKIFSVLIPST